MVEILDCTLRDGSYAIDFGFTAAQTAQISGALYGLGFPYIEIGHGIGMGASRSGYGVAACSDQEYAKVAWGNWGMFCIPGIADLTDLDDMASLGMKFVRVGCNIDAVQEAAPFISRARELGLYVFSNLMKSYAAPPRALAASFARTVEYGAQCVYIVDSAGGMIANDILEYWRAIREFCGNVRIGFHGHNNIGLAVANALAAAAFGIDVIDCTLQGIGRSGGNVPTEHFLASLEAQGSGRGLGFSLSSVCRLGEDAVRPMLGQAGISRLDVISGVEKFHSSHLNKIRRIAKEEEVDVVDLIEAVAAQDRINASEERIRVCARNIAPVVRG